ncbi:hypothetical protein C1645_864298 [Glomus cerebriforme]|uniref:TLD-domain-containing protein n=1 Tax=Glomus cerebriforme TaxID=658196 RepID=A0A397T9X7_9GLOM|nr:hypothetical protein C1645_864298 [Glomus cerebriforme]
MDLMIFLLSKYEKLLNEEDGDITIIVGEEIDHVPKTFKAHSLILKTQCPWFKIALSKDWVRKEGEETIVIYKPNIAASTFEIILRYLYCGKISMSHTGKQILDILIAADELNLNEIFKYLQDTLLKSHNEWLRNNFFYIYEITLKHQEFKILREYFQSMINSKPDILFYSQDFIKMDKALLTNLLKLDNLVMSEIEIWRKMIYWGIENSKISKTLISNWDEEDFKELKTILDQSITFIRFNDISANDFYFEVLPYEKILSKQIKEDLIRYHLTSSFPHQEQRLLPSRKGVIDSNLITSLDATTLVKFIIKRTEQSYYRFAEIPYEFRLLIRGSQDGFNYRLFSSKCVDKGPTIVVMRVSGSRQIIGGYNPATWKHKNSRGSYFINCIDSFIFSFNAPGMNNIISRIKDYNNAIRYLSNGFTGPAFGDGDLVITGENFKIDKSCYCKKSSYQESIMESNEKFSVNEYEVFELVKKVEPPSFFSVTQPSIFGSGQFPFSRT